MSAKAKNGYRDILDLQNPKTFELFKKEARRRKSKEEARAAGRALLLRPTDWVASATLLLQDRDRDCALEALL